MKDPRDIHAKMDDLMADFAEVIAPDKGKELKAEIETIFRGKGLQMNKATLQSFQEGMSLALHMFTTMEKEKAKEMLVVAMSFLKLYEREAKN